MRRVGVTTLLRALPDVARLIARLVRDPVLPRGVKIALAAAAVYLLSPLDLLPDVVPILGYLDDALLVSVLVDGIVNHVDRALVLKYWPGSVTSLDKISRVSRLLAMWVPRRLKARLFS